MIHHTDSEVILRLQTHRNQLEALHYLFKRGAGPGDRAMAETIGVQSSSLRKSLRLLAADGLLEPRGVTQTGHVLPIYRVTARGEQLHAAAITRIFHCKDIKDQAWVERIAEQDQCA